MWFGKYLVQSGDICPHDIIEAMSHYCESRTSIGKLAISSGILTVKQVVEILEHQMDSEKPFGKIGIELGFLSQRDLYYLLGRQRVQGSWQKYLVKREIISQERLDFRLKEWHNRSMKEVATETHFLGP